MGYVLDELRMDHTMTSAKKRNLDLAPDLEDAIERRVASGSYASQNDVIRAALNALNRDEEDRARKLAALDAAIGRGIADADAGRVRPANEVFAGLREKYRRMTEHKET
jgi:antitoxin ParD1/3/4